MDQFNIDNCDVVGFDMDMTLARYDIHRLRSVLTSSMVNLLVHCCGYPKDFAAQIEQFNNMVCAGGLVCDITTGSFLKMDRDGNIEKMFQRREFASSDRIKQVYPPHGKWPLIDKFKQGAFNDSGKYWFMDDNFSVVMIRILAAMFAYEADKSTNEVEAYQQAYATFNKVIGMLWEPDLYINGTSTFMEYLKNNKDKLLHPVSDTVKKWLADLRRSNKVVFLMTSSYCDYADLVMSHCYGNKWTDCFDLVISNAQKPSFYTKSNSFKEVDATSSTVTDIEVDELKHKCWYSEGNGEILNRFIEKMTKKTDPHVVYFGDSLNSDIFWPPRMYKWDTVYIMDGLRCFSEACPAPKQEEDIFYSNSWGPLLCSEQTSVESLYSHVITSNGSVAIPSVEDMAMKGTNHDFAKFKAESSPTLRGFHPQPNCSMLVLRELVKLARKV